MEEERRAQQQGEEPQDHRARDLVVQVFVGVQGNAAHESKIDAHDIQADESHCRGAATDGAATHTSHIPPDTEGEDDDDHSADFEGRVEECARQIAEDPQLAEVQLPPQRVARRCDRQQQSADQDDQGRPADVQRRDRVEAAREGAQARHRERKGDSGAEHGAHVGDLSSGRNEDPPTPRDPRPPSAHSGNEPGESLVFCLPRP
ncbi:hypothetical protein MTE01_13640 [Microbacterium testaceum]|uniref:Uncharacterized protein n=1 Tax=Microbacterium testaceum TaxID=2033 RepID=A0A4Y3QKF3_MICTE|nr:hypothetical protein MTE01_13640 [Microbacterium testaceum]